MSNKIQKICVIGAGVMGSGIAALIANSSHEVILLDIVSKDSNDRNKIAKTAVKNLHIQKPPPLSFPDKEQYITIGNLEDDLKLIVDCDLVIEVIVEKLEIKHHLYKKIIPYLKKDAIIASNTSTLPLKKLKENLNNEIKSRFIITHFFNPPRYMELLELITDSKVEASVINTIMEFLRNTLGKTIVKCNDTPGFIANRIGCFLLELVVRRAISKKLDPLIIDQIFINCFKLPTTGIFGLYDLIGHDVMKLISSSLLTALPTDDRYNKIYLNTPVLDEMIEKKLIGRKGKGGFYRSSIIDGKKVKEIIDFNTLTYHLIKTISSDNIPDKITKEFLLTDSPYSNFFAEIITEFYVYLTSLVPEITDNIYDIDLAIKRGYGWKFGPFELLTQSFEGSWKWIIQQATLMKLPLSTYLQNQEYKKIIQDKFQDQHNLTQGSRKIIEQNNSATLYQYKDNLIFLISTKLNCLNKEVLFLLQNAVTIAENKKQALYIHTQGNNFSAGADLKLIASYIEKQDFYELEKFLILGQQVMLHLKYSPSYIISCALGAALGGGCELLLHSSFIIAHQELNSGLVEVALGLLPGWGGVSEMFLRSEGQKEKLIKNIKNILEYNKSTSADYFANDYSISNIQITMNKYSILEEALKSKLPEKIQYSKKITIPKITLKHELDNSKYTEVQNNLLVKFQELIDQYEQITEEELLTFERTTFLELAQTPKILDKLKKYFN